MLPFSDWLDESDERAAIPGPHNEKRTCNLEPNHESEVMSSQERNQMQRRRAIRQESEPGEDRQALWPIRKGRPG